MKIKPEQYDDIHRKVRIEKNSLKQVAMEYGVTPGRISQIVIQVQKDIDSANQGN